MSKSKNSADESAAVEISENIQSEQPVEVVSSPQAVAEGHKRISKRAVLNNLKQLLVIFGAALATAVSLEVFLLPCDIVIGGALGVSSILDVLLCVDASKWYFSAGIWLTAVNIPIFIYCFVSYKKHFAIKTLLYVLMLSAMLITLRLLRVSSFVEQLMYGEGERDKVIYIILGGALHGLSLPMLLSVNASSGGSDIVGLIVQKRSQSSSSIAMRIIMLTNMMVVFISALVFGFVNSDVGGAVNMFIYSVAAMFICEIVQEWIFKGFSAAVELEITTEKPVEMAEALQAGLKHGATAVKVRGGYSHQEKTMILCVVNKQQLTHARRIINQVDVHAFAYVENVKEVMGKGFVNKENDLEDR